VRWKLTNLGKRDPEKRAADLRTLVQTLERIVKRDRVSASAASSDRTQDPSKTDASGRRIAIPREGLKKSVVARH
jgi:hypothetical protein